MNATQAPLPTESATTSPPPDSGVPVLLVAGLACTFIVSCGLLYLGWVRGVAQREQVAQIMAENARKQAVLSAQSNDTPPRLPFMGDFPDFALTDQAGQPLGNAQLAGRVWVLQFFFACCDKSCPTMVRQMADLQRGLADLDLRFVSISVDPDRDTPAGVAAHAARFAELSGLADRSRWSLLTGSRPQIVKLLEDCRLPVNPTALVEQGPLGHVDKFFLIDFKGTLRGMYNYDEPARMKALEEDIATLGAERAQSLRSPTSPPGPTSPEALTPPATPTGAASPAGSGS